MIIAVIVTFLACALVLAHYIACATARVRGVEAPPLIDLPKVGWYFAVVLLLGYVGRGVLRQEWGAPEPLSTWFTVVAVIAYGTWVVTGWWAHARSHRPRRTGARSGMAT